MIPFRKHSPVIWTTAAIALIGLAIPMVFAWWILGRAPGVSVPAARRLIQDDSAILVAVDPGLAERIPLKDVWPYRSIMEVHGEAQVPNALRGRMILLICPGGIRSALAALHLRSLGIDRVLSVRGGYQEWITQPAFQKAGLSARLDSDAVKDVPSFRPSPIYEQLSAVLTFFGVKLIYSVLAAFLVFLLWRECAADLVALRWSMLAFFIGEGFCFVNVVIFGDHFLFFEHLHSAGMVVSGAFFVYALLEGLDSRLIHFSGDGRCAALGLCGRCFKHSDVPCGLRRTFLISTPILGLIASLPLFSPLRDTAYNTLILGTLYGYRHPIVHQLYELRYLPAVAVLLFACCFFTLLWVELRSVRISKVLFSAALGAMAFSFFRLILVAVFIENQVWFAAWEETSELIYVVMAGCVLFLFPRISPSIHGIFSAEQIVEKT